jgi:hypothetical protein
LDELAIPVDLQIDIHPVSKAVNNARNDDRSLIELIDVEESEPLSLF